MNKKLSKTTILKGFKPVYPGTELFEKDCKDHRKSIQLFHILPGFSTGIYYKDKGDYEIAITVTFKASNKKRSKNVNKRI